MATIKRGEKESSTTVGIKSDVVSLSLFDGRPNQKTFDTVCFTCICVHAFGIILECRSTVSQA